MEFLDPEQKKARTVKLFVGYGLVTVAIALATLILVYLAQGYGYSGKQGVTQNSLLFIQSAPAPANITIDNQNKGTTDARLVLPEGKHDLVLSKDKYRNWAKSFNLEGGIVQYFLYPKLFPVDIPVTTSTIYETSPSWASQSLDRRWLVTGTDTTPTVLKVNDLLKTPFEQLEITIPSNILSNEKGSYGSFSPLEWSDDNKHILLVQTLPSGALNYIIVDKDSPNSSVNVTRQINLSAGRVVELRDKKYDKYFVHDTTTGALFTADLKSGLSNTPFATGVVDYKSYADEIILFATYVGAEPNQAKIIIQNGTNNKYQLQNIDRTADNKYLLDIARFDGDWEFVVSSKVSNKIQIYLNPLSKSKANDTESIVPQLSFALNSPEYVSFSDNARFISSQSGKLFVVYDSEQKRLYRFEVPINITQTQQAKWMDGHRLTAVTDGKVQVFEFDGGNLQSLTTSLPSFTPYFDRDYQNLFTFITQADGKTALQDGQLEL
jgi:hypothetical protein